MRRAGANSLIVGMSSTLRNIRCGGILGKSNPPRREACKVMTDSGGGVITCLVRGPRRESHLPYLVSSRGKILASMTSLSCPSLKENRRTPTTSGSNGCRFSVDSSRPVQRLRASLAVMFWIETSGMGVKYPRGPRRLSIGVESVMSGPLPSARRVIPAGKKPAKTRSSRE